MTDAAKLAGLPTPPTLSDLFARYLQSGLASAAPEQTVGEVVPFEMAPTQPVDPRPAWHEALAAARWFPLAGEPLTLAAPPEWPALVALPEPMHAVAFCLGNYPQLVRSLQTLLTADDLGSLRPTGGRPLEEPALLARAEALVRQRQVPEALLALGALRLARQYDQAAALWQTCRAAVPEAWHAVCANEEAALAWHRGEADAALAAWQAQPESVPVLFNRGLALLFLGQQEKARAPLTRAADHLPEECSWHHLARLYLALAEMRGA